MSRTQLRRCAARGCQSYVNRSLLMCADHWRKVPTLIKREVNAAFRERGSDPSATMTQRYADAMIAAVNAATPVEPAPADTPAADAGADQCGVCFGRGGTISGEMQGDPPMTAYVEWYEACDSCIGDGKCSGCMATTVPAAVIDGTAAIDDFTCPACGWKFDNSRFYPDDDGGYDDFDQIDRAARDWRDDGGYSEHIAGLTAQLDDMIDPFSPAADLFFEREREKRYFGR